MEQGADIEVISVRWTATDDESWGQFKADFAGSSCHSDEALDGYSTDRARRLASALGIDLALWDDDDSALWRPRRGGQAQPELYVLSDGRWAVVQGSRAAIETGR